VGGEQRGASAVVETSVAGGASMEVAHEVAVASQALSQPQAPSAPSLWRNREFRIVLFGQTVSIFGDAISFTALPLLVVLLTGSGVAMGTVGVLQTLPDLILGLPAGALADRWDRRKLVIYADLGRALLTALVPLSIVFGWPTMAIVILVAFPINALRVLFMAGWTAIMPSIVGRDQVGRANGYAEAIFSLSFIAGPAIAGALAGAIGPGPTLALDAASFLVSAGAMLLIRRPLKAERADTSQHLLADITEGLRYLIGHPVLRSAVGFWTIVSIALAPIAPALIYYLTIDRQADAGVVGLILSAYGVGSLVGALIAGRFSHGPLGRIMLIANLGSALVIAAFALAPITAIQIGLSLIVGITNALVFIPYLTLRATIPPNELLGRVGSTARMISIGLSPIGLFLAGLSLDAFGGEATILAIAAIVALTSLAFCFSVSLRTATTTGAVTPAAA
jgi:MFS family permease